MAGTIFFVKSFEEDFWLKTLKGKKKVRFQSVQNILETGKIRPNTKSFGKQSRLACSIISPNYLKTYRSQGLIFQTKAKPDIIYPFDLVLLTDAKKVIVQYYRIKDKLGEYYAHKLIKGSEKFVFKDFQSMLKQFPSTQAMWNAVNKFRQKAGYPPLHKAKKRLVGYCEVIFHKPIKIKPVAVYGYTKLSRDIARRNKLPHFALAKKFYEMQKQKPVPRKRMAANPKPRRRK